jgi:hypothetical protein
VKYTAEMDSGAMIYVSDFMNIGSDIQKLMEGYTDTDSMAIA